MGSHRVTPKAERLRRALRHACGVALTAFVVLGVAPTRARAQHIDVAIVSGTINPASADHLVSAVSRAESDGALALLIELDTPGGLLSSTKDIIQALLGAKVPVIVYVAPAGAWAGSAGTFITLASHVAAMAPGTTIGAAHPVGIGTPPVPMPGERKDLPDGKRKQSEPGPSDGSGRDFAAEKAENFTAAFIESIAKARGRNVEWAISAVRQSVAIAQDEALRIGVIDLVAADRAALLHALEGREITLNGEKRTLALAGAEEHVLEMTLLARFMNVIADPNIAVLLLLVGLVGLYIEFTTPGVVVPGVVGVASALLGAFALQMLPFSWLALLLMLAGIGCFVAELFVTSFGLLFVLGAGCFLLGGSTLIAPEGALDVGVSFFGVLVPAVVGLTLFAGVVVYAVGRSFANPPLGGVHDLVGKRVRANGPLSPEGVVFMRGEYWNVCSESPVEAGEEVEVLAVEGLRLRVRPTGVSRA